MKIKEDAQEAKEEGDRNRRLGKTSSNGKEGRKRGNNTA
jgi:hypothetical protein